MKYNLVIFDLDGTALNTIGDIASAINGALRAAGFAGHAMEEVRRSIGGGVGNLVRLSLPEDAPESVYREILSDFSERYSKNLDVLTAPFDGIVDLFTALKEAGIAIAVNSNKVDAAVNQLCRAHFGDLVALALGERPDFPRKPSPAGAQHIMRALNISPEHTLYVGDGEADIQTARNAGIDCAWVSWGYRRREELAGLEIHHAFDSVQALKDFILSQVEF